MSDWIKRRDDELRIAHERQERRARVLPAKAEEMWRGLIALIRDDVSQINSTAHLKSRIGGNLSFLHDDAAHQFRVILDLPLSKRLHVEFNRHSPAMSATFYRRADASARETPEQLPPVGFDLAEDGTAFFTGGDGKAITPEKISEAWLMPFTQ